MSFISIITCTHNPEQSILNRLVAAISELTIPIPDEVEWIIVDNNSIPAVDSMPHLKDDKTNEIPVRIIKEKKAGLTAARKAGIEHSQGEWIIFFDDDNVPDHRYLLECDSLIKGHPKVGVWGAGRIDVEFLGVKKSKWIERKKSVFQQRQLKEKKIASIPSWQSWYPIGTGMVAKKSLLMDYLQEVEAGNYTVSDRKGNELSSGGDVQIVLHSIKKGHAVGSSPALKLHHVISEKKTTYKYLFKHGYWVNSSALIAFNQVFPEERVQFFPSCNFDLLRIMYAVVRLYLSKEGLLESIYRISKRFGECNARYIAYPQHQKPSLLSWWEGRIAS